MLEKTYRSMNAQIEPGQELINDTIELMRQQSRHVKHKTRPMLRRPIVAAAMFVLCIVLATPVLAANVPAIYHLMYLVSPDVAQFFAPVQKAYEDNGIRMEVVSAYIHDSTAEIYVTLQDLTSDRIDETTDLFDSYSINRAFDSAATCQLVGYEKETKTATFLIRLTEWGNQDIAGSKLTFSIREFISRKTSLEGVAVGIDLGAVGEAEAVQTVDALGLSGKNIGSFAGDSGGHVMLVPGDTLYTPTEGLEVTAIGYVEGMLHIQLATSEKLTLDNHGYFYLVDQDGNQIQSDYSVSFAKGLDSDARVDYQEFVFDIAPDEIEKYSLRGSFWTSGLRTEGSWRVTFPLLVSE